MITLSFSLFFIPKPLYAGTTQPFSCTLNALYSCTPQYLYLSYCRRAAWMLNKKFLKTGLMGLFFSEVRFGKLILPKSFKIISNISV